MTRGIFLAGNESALSRAIEAEAENRAEQYAVALIPNRFSGTLTANTVSRENEKRLLLEWNPSSPISARTLVIAAENRLEHIDEAVLFCSPPSIRCSAAGLPLSDVEIMINDNIRGWFFLVRELAAVFSSRKHGTLALVYQDAGTDSRKDDMVNILGPSSLASFRAFMQGLLAAARNESYITTGFSASSASGKESAFAAFIFKNLDKGSKQNNGKHNKFGIFNSLKFGLK